VVCANTADRRVLVCDLLQPVGIWSIGTLAGIGRFETGNGNLLEQEVLSDETREQGRLAMARSRQRASRQQQAARASKSKKKRVLRGKVPVGITSRRRGPDCALYHELVHLTLAPPTRSHRSLSVGLCDHVSEPQRHHCPLASRDDEGWEGTMIGLSYGILPMNVGYRPLFARGVGP